MKLPTIDNIKTSRSSVAEFRGLNQKDTCTENEFREFMNLSLDEYPYIKTLPRYSKGSITKSPLGYIIGTDKASSYLIASDGIYRFSDNTKYTVPFALSGRQSVYVRGEEAYIYPSGLIFNLTSKTVSKVTKEVTKTNVTISMTGIDGTPITYHDDTYYEGHTPKNGDYLLYTEDGVSTLKQYNSTQGAWITITSSYVQFSATGIGSSFKEGEGVKITADATNCAFIKNVLPLTDEGRDYYGTVVLKKVTADAIVISGIISSTGTSPAVTIKKEMPELLYVTEYNNRLWGCSKDGREIYATELGDYSAWNVFEGISTDSYAVTIGSNGVFTGAVSYLGYPMFFKEDSLIKIAVSSTGAHQIKETSCKGVRKNASDSVAIVNDLLYFLSPSGVCVYDGSLPTTLDERFSYKHQIKSVSSVVSGNKYILTYFGANNEHSKTFIYDTKRKMWTEEAFLFVNSFKWGEYQMFDMSNLTRISESQDSTNFPASSVVTGLTSEWMLETKDIDYDTPDSKYIYGLTVKMSLKVGAMVKISVRYDEGSYECVTRLSHWGTSVVPINLKLHRCNSFSVKIEGKGEAKIYSITKTLAEGSDKY